MVEVPVLRSRLSPPSWTGDSIDRPRLMDLISDGSERKLVLLSAPAGFGKTTLVDQWLRQQHLPFVWLSADLIHEDPRVFLQYLLSGLGDIFDGFRPSGRHIPLLQGDWDPTFILGHLINTVIEGELRFVLVIDDYHVIDTPGINELVRFLLKNLPSGVTMIVTSRTDPDIPLAGMRAKRELLEIRSQDLQLTAPESRRLLEREIPSGLREEDIRRIHERTEGWITGIHLTSLAHRRNGESASRYTDAFFFEEILEQEDEHLVAFLLRTSVLSLLHAPLCDALLPDRSRSSEAVLSELLDRNLFIRAVDAEEGWYVLHPLFRECLAAACDWDIRLYHRRAGIWFWERGLLGECFHHLSYSGDYSMMAGYLAECWETMDQSFRFRSWLEWAEKLPVSEIHSHPLVMNQMAWALLQSGRLDESEAMLNRQETLLADGIGDDSLVLQIHSARAYLAFARRDSDGSNAFALKMEQAADPDDAVSRIQARSYRALSQWYRGEYDRAYNEFTAFRDVMMMSSTPFFALASYLALVQIRILQGRSADARSLLKEALGFVMGPADILAKFKASLHLKAAAFEFELGDRASMGRHLESSSELARRGSLIDYHYQWHQFQALIHESDGRWAKASEELDLAEHLFVRTLYIDDLSIGEQQARIWIRSGKKTTLKKYCGSLIEGPNPVPSCQEESGLIIRVRYALGFCREPSVLRDHLEMVDKLLEAADREGRRKSIIELTILKILILHRLDRDRDVVVSAMSLLRHVEETGFIQAVILERDPLESILRRFSDQLESVEAYRRILDLCHEQAHRYEILSPRELEVLKLMANGYSNKRIAGELYVAETTIKGHNQRIFGKLHARNRTEAIAEGRKAGLIG